MNQADYCYPHHRHEVLGIAQGDVKKAERLWLSHCEKPFRRPRNWRDGITMMVGDADKTRTPFRMNEVGRFPINRRPQRRGLSDENQSIINDWFNQTELTIGDMADTPQRRDAVKRLLYTWRDCFVRSVRDIKATDLIEHSIDLAPGAKPVKAKMKRYSQREREFAAKAFPDMGNPI